MSPATWVAGQVVTAANLNQELRDELRYIKGLDGTTQRDAGLEVTGTAAYVMVTGITTTQRDALTGSAGMLIYNSSNSKFEKYEGGTFRADLAWGGTLTSLRVPSQATGDVFYADTGTSIARLGAGTSGQFLKTQGVAAPAWASLPTELNVGSTILGSANTEAFGTGGASLKAKELRVFYGGTLRFTWDMKAGTIISTAYSRVFRNSGAVGTEYGTAGTTYGTFTNDISGWEQGDLAQLYLRNEFGANTTYLRNFQIQANAGHNNSQVILDGSAL